MVAKSATFFETNDFHKVHQSLVAKISKLLILKFSKNIKTINIKIGTLDNHATIYMNKKLIKKIKQNFSKVYWFQMLLTPILLFTDTRSCLTAALLPLYISVHTKLLYRGDF